MSVKVPGDRARAGTAEKVDRFDLHPLRNCCNGANRHLGKALSRDRLISRVLICPERIDVKQRHKDDEGLEPSPDHPQALQLPPQSQFISDLSDRSNLSICESREKNSR